MELRMELRMEICTQTPCPPPGYHWTCVGYALLPACTPVCRATNKAVGRDACRMMSCHDLAERNARLVLQNKITPQRAAVLAQDLQRYCYTAGTYYQWLLDNRDNLPLVNDRGRRRELRQRRKALRQWISKSSSDAQSHTA